MDTFLLTIIVQTDIYPREAVGEAPLTGKVSEDIWASSQENLRSGSPTKQVSNQSPQLQTLARRLLFNLWQINI